MCGIAGILSLGGRRPEIEELVRMAGAIRHRGPDEFGVYRDAACGLAHARLSIIDLQTGQQPMPNEDGSIHLIYNGEVFNYVELRAELQSKGHRFRTKSDTEVIIHAWEEWQHEAFSRMNGQWAIALWDAKRRTLVLCRDRLGVRPLYVGRRSGRMYWASEVKAIFAADPDFPRRLDAAGIDETFTFWSVVPPQSVFEGIEELEPGHTLVVDAAGERRSAWFLPQFPKSGDESRASIEDATDAVGEALERATRLRMVRADVPVGSYLSGGLDSSLVAALGLRASGGKFSTFSLRFEDAEYDETAHQRAMVELLGSDHHEVVCRKGDIADVFPRVVYHTERPVLRTAPAPLLLLSELVRKAGIKVVLTGEGADEMFAGYDLFREAKLRRFCARHPDSTIRPKLFERLYPYLERSPVGLQAMTRQFFLRGLEHAADPGFSHDMRWQTTSALKRLYSKDFEGSVRGLRPVERLLASLPGGFGTWSFLAQDQYLEIRTLLAGYILSSQGDRMLMASSVEGRFPFLDADVIDLAARLPPSYKLRVLDEKHILKRLARGIVPASILARKKQPYRAPDATSFTTAPVRHYVEDLLGARSIADAGIFDAGRVAQLWGKCKQLTATGKLSNTDNMALVGVLSTQLLHDHFIAHRVVATDVVPQTLIDRFC
jgi:asparagine synthase (glutamine-hydrolysing)